MSEPQRQKHPGKFEGGLVVDEIAYGWGMEGGGGEELGDVQTFGFYQRHDGPFDRDDIARSAKDGGVELTSGDYDFVLKQAGAILYEDSQGFVSVEWFEAKNDLDRAWKHIESEYEKFEAESEGEDEGDGFGCACGG